MKLTPPPLQTNAHEEHALSVTSKEHLNEQPVRRAISMDDMLSTLHAMQKGVKPIRLKGKGPSKAEEFYLQTLYQQIEMGQDYFLISELPEYARRREWVSNHVRFLVQKGYLKGEIPRAYERSKYTFQACLPYDGHMLRDMIGKVFPHMQEENSTSLLSDRSVKKGDVQTEPLNYNIFDKNGLPILRQHGERFHYHAIDPLATQIMPLSMIGGRTIDNNQVRVDSGLGSVKVYNRAESDVKSYPVQIATVRYKQIGHAMYIIKPQIAFDHGKKLMVLLEETELEEPMPGTSRADAYKMYKTQKAELMNNRMNPDTSLVQLEKSVTDIITHQELLKSDPGPFLDVFKSLL